MKSTEVTRLLKEKLGAGSNDELVAAVERLEGEARRLKGPRRPVGVLLTMDPESGQYWATPFGSDGELSLLEVQRLHWMCRHFAEVQLRPIVRQLERREIEAAVRAEMEKGGRRAI